MVLCGCCTFPCYPHPLPHPVIHRLTTSDILMDYYRDAIELGGTYFGCVWLLYFLLLPAPPRNPQTDHVRHTDGLL